MSFVGAAVINPEIETSVRQQALDRVYTDPGAPSNEKTTQSFWVKDPHPEIAYAQSDILPLEADIVIIGSGITGTSIAKSLLDGRRDINPDQHGGHVPLVMMLEAREICSGATGRNGGHILETAEEYADLKAAFGQAEAAQITRFRLLHLKATLDVVDDLQLRETTQAREVKFVSAYFDNETWAAARTAIQEFKEDLPDISVGWDLIEGEALAKEFLLSGAVGAVAGRAGAMWPYRFVTSVLSFLRTKYPSSFTIESHTPALSIEAGAVGYEVKTPRGTIHCKHVVHCTNAHVSNLVPGLRGRVFPIRGQMSAQRPGSGFPNQSQKHSWVFNYERGFDYLTQLPVVDGLSNGEMMLGGGFVQTEGYGIAEVGIASDDKLNVAAGSHLRGVLKKVFDLGKQEMNQFDTVTHMWTGNMGFSADSLPWIGRLPSSCTGRQLGNESGQSEWVAAGFSGEGMVNCWLSGQALALMILDHQGIGDEAMVSSMREWFPSAMLVSELRLEKSVLPRYVQ